MVTTINLSFNNYLIRNNGEVDLKPKKKLSLLRSMKSSTSKLKQEARPQIDEVDKSTKKAKQRYKQKKKFDELENVYLRGARLPSSMSSKGSGCSWMSSNKGQMRSCSIRRLAQVRWNRPAKSSARCLEWSARERIVEAKWSHLRTIAL